MAGMVGLRFSTSYLSAMGAKRTLAERLKSPKKDARGWTEKLYLRLLIFDYV